ncbi:MAG: NAD-dependent epimerase/dehydratase family protein [Myxococcales bacterium]|nr:NAD-dependent epimerase/dehydratase family protein [Myxococcales bacterium]
MQILLTGAAGFIGSSLTARLLARGDEVLGLDNFDETLYPPAQKERNLASLAGRPGFRFLRGDFLDEKVAEELVSARPDAVVHLGALAGVRPSLEQPKRYQKVNIEGTLNLLEACRAHGVGRFLFASSSSVYGAHSRVPFHEDDPAARPASPYAATKRAGELLCSNYSDLYPIVTSCLRFFTVYGPRQRPEMAIHKFTRLIDAGLPVPLFGDGSTARDYTFIEDILDGVVAAIDETAARKSGERCRIFNLGGSRTTTLKRLVELIEAALGKRALLDWQPDQPGDVPITYADVTRAGAELGYSPRVGIEEGIARFVSWYRDQKAEKEDAPW